MKKKRLTKKVILSVAKHLWKEQGADQPVRTVEIFWALNRMGYVKAPRGLDLDVCHKINKVLEGARWGSHRYSYIDKKWH